MYLRKKGQAGGSYQKKGKNRERKNVSLPSAVENVKTGIAVGQRTFHFKVF